MSRSKLTDTYIKEYLYGSPALQKWKAKMKRANDEFTTLSTCTPDGHRQRHTHLLIRYSRIGKSVRKPGQIGTFEKMCELIKRHICICGLPKALWLSHN